MLLLHATILTVRKGNRICALTAIPRRRSIKCEPCQNDEIFLWVQRDVIRIDWHSAVAIVGSRGLCTAAAVTETIILGNRDSVSGTVHLRNKNYSLHPSCNIMNFDFLLVLFDHSFYSKKKVVQI